MELYFKDLEDEAGASVAGDPCSCEDAGVSAHDAAEDRAFAELSERVSAARLVY